MVVAIIASGATIAQTPVELPASAGQNGSANRDNSDKRDNSDNRDNSDKQDNNAATDRGLGLRWQRSIQPPPATARDRLPVFVSGERIESQGPDELEVNGAARLRKGDLTLDADRLRYFPGTDETEATGSVRLRTEGAELRGPRLRFRVDDQIGVFNTPIFSLRARANARRTAPADTPSISDTNLGLTTAAANPQERVPSARRPVDTRGDAESIRFEGDDRYRVSDGRVTSCKPGDESWYLAARDIELDMDSGDGIARGARLSFKGVSTPTLPWLPFAVNNQRKTGFLPPTLAYQGNVGPEVMLPFYLNLAPNRDATISARIMAQRGLQLLNEFRYLEPTFNGAMRFEYLHRDQVLGQTRSAFSWQQTTQLPRGAVGTWDINRVSDDNYFRDLSSRLAVATNPYQYRQGQLSYPISRTWAASARLQRIQVLQDLAAPIGVPYDRVPQLTLVGQTFDAYRGLDVGMNSEFVAFEHPTAPLARRLSAYPFVTWPILRPGAFFTPKLGLHMTRYSLSRAVNSGDPVVAANAESALTRVVPIGSVDTGLVFERDLTMAGSKVVNTLEPRLYYLNVPFRDQSRIPVFDSSSTDFNYAQIFSENVYSGGDRISDANQVTAAITSRLIVGDSGQEVLRGLIGQRYHFSPQKVGLASTLPLRTDPLSSLLLGVAGRVTPTVSVEGTFQLASPASGRVVGTPERFNIAMRYQPAVGKILNLGYRYTNTALNPAGAQVSLFNPTGQPQELRQLNISGQWPIGANWYVVGRYNYSIINRVATEALFGFEYNEGCWTVRAVAQRFITSVGSETNLFFLQLELDGFSRIGSNPLEVLRRNIPGYTLINQPGTQPGATRQFDFNTD